jgi:hypothetical protein
MARLTDFHRQQQCWDAIPGRARVAVCVLRWQGIKCPYRGRSMGDVHGGALERDDPRRGGVEPSSEADLARGVGLIPRARRTPPEGALRPRARRNSPEGSSNPRARRTSLEGHSAVLPWRAVGGTRVAVVSCTCF